MRNKAYNKHIRCRNWLVIQTLLLSSGWAWSYDITTNYIYDDLYRLTNVEYSAEVNGQPARLVYTTTYQYDKNSNRIGMTRTAGAPEVDEVVSVDYDAGQGTVVVRGINYQEGMTVTLTLPDSSVVTGVVVAVSMDEATIEFTLPSPFAGGETLQLDMPDGQSTTILLPTQEPGVPAANPWWLIALILVFAIVVLRKTHTTKGSRVMKFNAYMVLTICLAVGFSVSGYAQGVPLSINYQGKVEVDGIPFEGVGQFKFAIVDDPVSPTEYLWTNDGSDTFPVAPTTAVDINVTKGAYSINLGDISRPNMTEVPKTVFETPATYLRVWFDDGTNGWELLAPDRQLVTVPYAYTAENLSDTGSVTPLQVRRTNSEIALYGTSNLSNTWITLEKSSGVPYNTGSYYLLIKDIAWSVNGWGVGTSRLRIAYDDGTGESIVFGSGRYCNEYFDSAIASDINFMVRNQAFLPNITYNLEAGILVKPNSEIKVMLEGVSFGFNSISISGYEIEKTNVWSTSIPFTSDSSSSVENLPAGTQIVITDAIIDTLNSQVTISMDDSTEVTNLLTLIDKIHTREHWLTGGAPAGERSQLHLELPTGQTNLVSFSAGLPVEGPCSLDVFAAAGSGSGYITLAGFISGFTPSVMFNGTGSGTVQYFPEPPYTIGQTITLTAVPDSGNCFKGWTGDIISSDETIQYVIDGSMVQVEANFETLALNVTIVGPGTVDLNPPPPYTAPAICGQEITLTPIPDSGETFYEWSGDLSGSNIPETVILDGTKNITAAFSGVFFQDEFDYIDNAEFYAVWTDYDSGENNLCVSGGEVSRCASGTPGVRGYIFASPLGQTAISITIQAKYPFDIGLIAGNAPDFIPYNLLSWKNNVISFQKNEGAGWQNIISSISQTGDTLTHEISAVRNESGEWQLYFDSSPIGPTSASDTKDIKHIRIAPLYIDTYLGSFDSISIAR